MPSPTGGLRSCTTLDLQQIKGGTAGQQDGSTHLHSQLLVGPERASALKSGHHLTQQVNLPSTTSAPPTSCCAWQSEKYPTGSQRLLPWALSPCCTGYRRSLATTSGGSLTPSLGLRTMTGQTETTPEDPRSPASTCPEGPVWAPSPQHMVEVVVVVGGLQTVQLANPLLSRNGEANARA